MAVPKKRTSKSKTRMRRSHRALRGALPGTCEQCGAARESHRACPGCGFYRGRQIFAVAEEEEV
jgi:large subunit ribosomal protein L32